MSTLGILTDETAGAAKPGFWAPQFAPEVTAPQTIFDVLVGVVGPVLCFVFDPVVFKFGSFGPPLFAKYQLFVYAFSALEIVFLCLWLASRGSFGLANGLISAVLLWGGIFSAAIGLVLLPFTLLGLIFGIGIFGFTPLLTAIVYLRNGVRAWESDKNGSAMPVRAASVLLALIIITGLPFALSFTVHGYVNGSIKEILAGDAQHAMAAAHSLRSVSIVASSELDKLVSAYLLEKDPARKQLIKACYQEATGEDIETRVQILQD